MLRRVFGLLALVGSLACGKEGPMGPAGPQGPPGPAGPSGSVNRADFTGTIGTSGSVAAPLPTASVAGGRVPVIACYVSNDRRTWVAVAQVPPQDGFPYCALGGIGTTTPIIGLIDVPAGFYYYIIAAW